MKVPLPIAKPQHWVLPVTLVCLAVGMLVASLTRVVSDAGAGAAGRTMQEQLEQLQRSNAALQHELDDANKKITETATNVHDQQKDMNDLRLLVGAVPAEGPGIVITIDDTNVLKSNPADISANALITHDTDLQVLVNELYSAGAEEISIDGQRVGANTAIRCVGPVIHVNFRPVAPPFIVRAIGKSDTLNGAVNLPGGELDILRGIGIKVTVEKSDKIEIPALATLPSLEVSTISKNPEPPPTTAPR